MRSTSQRHASREGPPSAGSGACRSKLRRKAASSIGVRATPMREKLSDRRPPCFRCKSEGTSNRRVRSPVTPKITSAQGGAGAARIASGLEDERTSAMGFGAWRLDMAAELLSHSRQQLLGEGMLPARSEASVERCGDHVGGYRLLDRGHDRPAAFAGVRNVAGECMKVRVLRQCRGAEVEQPG